MSVYTIRTTDSLAGKLGGQQQDGSPLEAAKLGFREWIDPTIPSTITGSPVAVIRSPLAGSFVNPSNFQRTTVAGSPGDRPAITANRLVFNGTTQLLDGSAGYTYLGATTPKDTFYCEPGKGPTTTGLVRLPDGTWWLGGFGKKNITTAAGETFDGGPIHYNASFSSIIQEIRFSQPPISLPNIGMQGVTLDYTAGVPNGSIWVADPGTGNIFLINPAGPTVTRTLTFVGANGLAYDTINNELWVSLADSATLTRINKTTGATTVTFTHRDLTENTTNDMLFFDGSYSTAGALYQTCRNNLTPGRIVKYDLASFTPVKAWFITEIQAMEGGLHVTGNTFETCSDEYYHNTAANVNRVVATLADTSSPNYGTRLILAGVAKIASTPASSVALISGGDPNSVGAHSRIGAGLYFTTTANQFRFIGKVNGTQVVFNFALTSTTTEFLYYCDIDTVAHTVTMYVNGVIVGGLQFDANLTGPFPSLVWTMAAAYESTALPTRFAAVTVGGWVLSTDATHRAEIEGLLNWGGNGADKGLLPVGHLYKTRAPV